MLTTIEPIPYVITQSVKGLFDGKVFNVIQAIADGLEYLDSNPSLYEFDGYESGSINFKGRCYFSRSYAALTVATGMIDTGVDPLWGKCSIGLKSIKLECSYDEVAWFVQTIDRDLFSLDDWYELVAHFYPEPYRMNDVLFHIYSHVTSIAQFPLKLPLQHEVKILRAIVDVLKEIDA